MRSEKEMAIYHTTQAWKHHEAIEEAIAKALISYEPKGYVKQADVGRFVVAFLSELGFRDENAQKTWELVRDIIQ